MRGRRRGWPWWRAVRWATFAVALALAASALHTSRRADAIDEQTAALTAQSRTTTDQEARALRQASRRVVTAYDVDRIVGDLLDANIDSSRALARLTGALTRAVDQANAGDLAGLHRIAEVDGGAALDDLRQLIGDQDELLAQVGRALDRASPDEGGSA